MPGPPAITRLAARSMIQKPAPAAKRPKANLAGLDGLRPRLRRASQRIPKTGARRITKTEFAACSQVVGDSQPKIRRSVKSRAKRFRDVGACSKAPLKIVANMHISARTPKLMSPAL